MKKTSTTQQNENVILKNPANASSKITAHPRELSVPKELVDLTQHEIQALKHDYNLADAHTHQSQSKTQREIVARLPELWYDAEKNKQYDLEQKFINTFFRLRRQPMALKNNNAMLVYAASIAMIATANFLKQRNLSVTLIEPCFDNLPGILRNLEVPMESLSEELLYDVENIYTNLEKNVHGDALFLVDPNNPTGFTLMQFGKKGFEEVIRFCKDHQKILVLDLCFAAFLYANKHLAVFDLYEMAENAGITYIFMEDTGKTWPLQDAKIAILKTSRDIYNEMFNIHTSYLLNVSPFILNFLTEYLLDSEKDKFASVFNLLEHNRAIAKKLLEGSLLEVYEPVANLSVVWCKIKNFKMKATELQKIVEQAGVYILPGTYFFWQHPEEGEKYIRIALARNPEIFEPAIVILRKTLDEL